jgi:hypothetical protein
MIMKRTIFLVLIAAVLLFNPGCYGPFNLTKSLHEWNGEVGGKWADEGVFLCLVIIPVYGVCMFVDAIVLNSIEFWTGDNPVEDTSMIMPVGDQVVELTKIGTDEDQLYSVRVLEGDELAQWHGR